jgi:translation initiation factor 3 subunit C
MRAGSSDDSDSDEERVVRSAKDKRFIELRQTVAEVDNKSKISDWLTITTLFDKLNKQLDKTVEDRADLRGAQVLLQVPRETRRSQSNESSRTSRR